MIPLQFKVVSAVFASVLVTALTLVLTVAAWSGDVPFRPDPADARLTAEASRVSTVLSARLAEHDGVTLAELDASGRLPTTIGVFGNVIPVVGGGLAWPDAISLSPSSGSPFPPSDCLAASLEGVAALASSSGSTVTTCGWPGQVARRTFTVVNAPGTPARTWVVLVWAADSSEATPRIDGLAGLTSVLAIEAAVLLAFITRIVVWATDKLGKASGDAVRAADRIREGDLTARMRSAGRSDEFGVIASSFNAVADQLSSALLASERSVGQQRRFVSDTAHELRTPTAALLASATALEDPATRDEAAVKVAPQLRRLANLTENLLTLSRLDAGRTAVIADEVDLADLAAEAAREAGRGCSSSGPPLLVRTDPMLVRGVLDNLIANGLRHGRPPVVVTVLSEPDAAVVTVSDAGDGVPETLRASLFDRFTRGDASRHGEGNGLGLAIAREHGRLLGGDLTLDADGRTFVVRLPLVLSGHDGAVDAPTALRTASR